MNQVFRKILAFQDAYRDSVESLEWSAKIVPANGQVKILDVQPPLTELWREMFFQEFEETPGYHRKKALSELARPIDFPTSDVVGQVRKGTPVVEIVREAMSGNFDLVVKEAYAKTSDFLFGSLDMRLLRNSPIPVWLVNPKSAGKTCERIMVALNPEAGDKEMKLNERLLRYAAATAMGFNCQLFVVAAYRSHATAFPILDRDSLKRIKEHSKTAKRHAREKLDALVAASQREVLPSNIILEDGMPDEVILESVTKIEPDLLVIGSVARHGATGLLIGNVADRVLRQVECSILAIKPQNFVSPIPPDVEESNEQAGLRIAFLS